MGTRAVYVYVRVAIHDAQHLKTKAMRYPSLIYRLLAVSVIAGAGIVVSAGVGGSIPAANAAVSNWQKGVSMYPASSGDFGSQSFDQSLSNAHNAGANTVALIIPYYQSNDQSSDIGSGWNTPTDASIVSAANYARSLGMSVVLKPHVDPYNGDWRANINAINRDAWYGAYSYYLNHLGDLATQTGSQGMVIGTELISMSDYTVNADNTERWQGMIASLKHHFSGFLTYSANWGGSDYAEEAPHIGFWSSLDYIGISAYYPLADGQSSPSQDALTSSWNYWDTSKIAVLHNQYNKPVIFTEIGYRSVDDAHNLPWYAGSGGNYNPTEQVNDYQALLTYWNNQPYMDGIYVWNWDTNPNYGGTGNTDFTPQNKPAQDTIQGWFGGTTGGNTGGPGGGPSSFAGTLTMNASSPTLSARQAASIPFTISTSDHASNVVIDAEIYDQSGHQVGQQFFTGQNITTSQAGSYTITSWTPLTNGQYSLKVGVFSSDWSQLYVWNNSVVVLNVGTGGNNGGNSGNPGPAVLDVWWPGNGSTVSGVQPFKAIVEGEALSVYTMYWQVDGGALVQMGDSHADYAHKEFDVDLGPWNWSGSGVSGPYSVTFVAKDLSGNTVASKSVSISVAHW